MSDEDDKQRVAPGPHDPEGHVAPGSSGLTRPLQEHLGSAAPHDLSSHGGEAGLPRRHQRAARARSASPAAGNAREDPAPRLGGRPDGSRGRRGTGAGWPSAPANEREGRLGAGRALVGFHPRHVAHLAARTGLALAVEVQMRAGLGQDARQVATSSPIRFAHLDAAEPARRAERPAADGAHVLLELRGLGALDRPMAGIVNARGDLVDDDVLARRGTSRPRARRRSPSASAIRRGRRRPLPARSPRARRRERG